MKTKQLLVMTAVAFAAGAAGAAVAEPSLTLYGNLDMSLTHTKSESTGRAPVLPVVNTSTTAVTSGVMSSSFIGFKGTEDLGNGMEAQFVLESYLDADTGATSANRQLLSALSRLQLTNPAATWNTRDEGAFWAKNAYVGLKTNFGLIRLGQMDNLGYLSAVKYNPFGTAAINPTTRVFYGTDYYARGWSNTLAYYLRADGFLFGIQHAPKNDNSVTPAAAGNQGGPKTTAVVSYATGPFNVSLGYEVNKDNISTPGEAKSVALHGSYDFGAVKLFAEYGSGKQDSNAALDVKSTGYQLGASAPIGSKGAFLVSYAGGQLKADNALLGVPVGTKFRDVKVFAVGYTHSLSKRSSIYATYDNEKDSYPIPVMTNLKLDNKQLSLGVQHSF